MRAFDAYLSTRSTPLTLRTLTVTFSKPVRQGDELEFSIQQQAKDEVQIEAIHDGKKVQVIKLALSEESRQQPHCKVAGCTGQVTTPDLIDLSQAEGLTGSAALTWDASAFQALFPHIAALLPDCQSATILASTKIVGMHCPGLNSVFARLSLEFGSLEPVSLSKLDYKVSSVDPRFSRVLMDVSNEITHGSIEAFFRPAPVQQASSRDIRSIVPSGRFAAQKALIVGGSRGLGELLAKLLAAGGADVTVSYASGQADALRVAEDIIDNQGNCQVVQLDVRDPDVDVALFEQFGKVSHIYYMASPLIEKSTAGLWDENSFGKYVDFYVHGLARLLGAFAGHPDYRKAKLCIFLPSTIFLQEPEKGFAEYAASKAAAEAFAQQARKKHPSWQFHVPRLPRMLTDQTSGVAGLDPLDNARHMLASMDAL
jgi:NADP-dependent 3-hydroxy acid dehydrogenase YdfG